MGLRKGGGGEDERSGGGRVPSAGPNLRLECTRYGGGMGSGQP